MSTRKVRKMRREEEVQRGSRVNRRAKSSGEGKETEKIKKNILKLKSEKKEWNGNKDVEGGEKMDERRTKIKKKKEKRQKGGNNKGEREREKEWIK